MACRTGATDNAPIAVAMEAVRIIQTLGLKPRRTFESRDGAVRGRMLGSRAYVAQHFGKAQESADASFARLLGAVAQCRTLRLAGIRQAVGYFNLDNGTGKIAASTAKATKSVSHLSRMADPFRDMARPR